MKAGRSSVWKFSDGTVLHSRGVVEGTGKASATLRGRLSDGPGVYVLPLPSEPIPVDVDSDYMLDLLAREVAQATSTKVSTAYVSNLDDAPEAIRDAVRRDMAAAQFRFYGVVH